MENVLKSISIEGRGATGELHRTSSLPQVLTFRTSLRRFLTGSDAPHTHPVRKTSRGDGRQREGEVFEEEELASTRDPGGMSVLLMSQELSLESNQEAFLRRFAASQVLYSAICLILSLSLALIFPINLLHFFCRNSTSPFSETIQMYAEYVPQRTKGKSKVSPASRATSDNGYNNATTADY
jgi:hypothetical protein